MLPLKTFLFSEIKLQSPLACHVIIKEVNAVHLNLLQHSILYRIYFGFFENAWNIDTH